MRLPRPLGSYVLPLGVRCVPWPPSPGPWPGPYAAAWRAASALASQASATDSSTPASQRSP